MREIRARGDVPVIVVSARADTGDKVELLKLGADDYLAKPFDLDELLARVSVQLRHASRGAGRELGARCGSRTGCSTPKPARSQPPAIP